MIDATFLTMGITSRKVYKLIQIMENILHLHRFAFLIMFLSIFFPHAHMQHTHKILFVSFSIIILIFRFISFFILCCILFPLFCSFLFSVPFFLFFIFTLYFRYPLFCIHIFWLIFWLFYYHH